jgi:hypothetical protein
MKPGDLVRVKLQSSSPDAKKLNGMLGIVLSPGKRGPLDVWKIMLQDGRTLSLQPVSLEMISCV